MPVVFNLNVLYNVYVVKKTHYEKERTMAKKTNWYYVLVMSDEGPVFVTKVNYSNKTAEWNKLERPKAFDKYWAEDLALGLNCNFHTAFTVCSKFELEHQPYRYSD